MSPEQIALLSSQAGFVIFKIGFLIILFMIGIFLLVVLKQIRSMNAIITQADLFPYLEMFVYVMELSVTALFIIGVVIL